MKKSVKILIVVLCLIIVGLVAFIVANEVMNSNNNGITNSIGNIESQELAEEEMYKSVINDYRAAINEYDEDDVYSIENIEEKYNMVSSTIIMHVAHYQSQGLRILYNFYDIDKNGVKELIVGYGTGNYFYEGAIYSYNKNTNKPEKIYYQSTLERGRLDIYDNGIILSEGSGGATLHYFSFGKIAEDGTSYESIEEIEEEYTQESEIPIYKDYKADKVLNYKSLDEIMDKYLSNAKIIEFNDYFEI